MANQKTDTQVRKEAAERILLALAGDKMVVAPDYTDRDKDIFLDRILDAIPSKQKQTPVANTGFGYDDVLVPNKPRSPFLNDGYYPETNMPTEEDLISALNAPATQPAAQTSAANAGFVPNTDSNIGVSYAGGLAYVPSEVGDIKPIRRRHTPIEQALAAAKDSFDYISGLDDKAYLGKTAELINKYNQTRMEEDPEGKENDINRAKVLSTRAAMTDNIEEKKKYGAAIKKLLPEETQGLDDLTASDFFNSVNNKINVELIKGYNKLKEIGEQNLGKEKVANLNNMSKETIAAQKIAAEIQMNALDNQIKEDIANGKYANALQLQNKKAELESYLHQLDNAAKMAVEEEKTSRSNYAADKRLEGQIYTADSRLEGIKIQQAAANMRALVTGGKKGATDAKTQQALAMVNFLTSPEEVDRFDTLNNAAGSFSWGGETWNKFTASERGQKWIQLESYMTRGIIQLAKSLGSNPSNEDAKRISTMFGLNSHLAPSLRREAWFNTLEYVAATAKAGLPVDGSISPEQVAGYYSANSNTPQATNNMINAEKGVSPTGQVIDANGNWIF